MNFRSIELKLAKNIIHTYAPSLDSQFAAGDNNLVYGLAVAYTCVDALNKAGPSPTRTSFMYQLRHLTETNNPFVYPGMGIKTTNSLTFPMQQLIFQKWDGNTTHDWKTFGNVLQSGH